MLINKNTNKTMSDSINCPICSTPEPNLKCNKSNYEVYECSSCTFVFSWPRPSEAQLHQFYQGYKNNKSYIQKVKKKTWTSKRKLRGLKPFINGNKFIDIGCSIGCVVGAAKELGYEARGVDLSRDAIEAARTFFPDCEFGSEDTQELIASQEKFDVIYCSEVIEHLIYPVGFLKDLKSLLNNNGIIYLTSPDVGHFSVPKDLQKWRHLSPPEHISLFNKTSLKNAIEQAGLELIKFKWSHKSTLKAIIRIDN